MTHYDIEKPARSALISKQYKVGAKRSLTKLHSQTKWSKIRPQSQDAFVRTNCSSTTWSSQTHASLAHDAKLQNTLENLPQAFGQVVATANKPMQEMLLLAQDLVKPKEVGRAQKFAAAVHKWTLPVVQVLLGAAVIVVGASVMEISILVMGATMCATGLALCATLLAGMVAPHPLDRVRKFLDRRQPRDPEIYKPGMAVMLDGSP